MIVASASVPRLLSSVVLGLALGALGACGKGGASNDGAAAPPAASADGSQANAAPAKVEPPAPTLPDAEGILAKAAEAMGGRAAIDAVKTFYYRGKIEMLGQNIHGTLEIWWQGGDFFMEQVVPGIGQMHAGKQGDVIWSEDPVNGRRKLSGVEAEQHAWASSLLLAAEWKRYFDRAETIAEREQDGKTIYDVQLSAASGLTVTMSFDATTGLQMGQSFEQVTPMGRQPFEVTFSDYREVDGIKIAFKQLIDAKVQKMVQVIEAVELGAEVDVSKFAYPRDGADVVVQPKAAAAQPPG
ncbi:MAG: hypothetical protein K0V04_04845 [Deltaproteobacteria bacterium]|nr:hypothetical protein [Deltaproteobacteria bacterium]